ncbi:glutathione S-transferase [Xylariaceae sp. FL0804]|nr:glutathione S-transferase [Xylariaceae sp. FL0804]
MPSSLKPIIVWGHDTGPNPYKVQIVLEELELPYEHKMIEFEKMKQEPYISLNPNGRVPTIEDPNTGITLWESGAIVQYLIDQYDQEEHKLSYGTMVEKYQIQQWIAFQISGQGPYYGQAVWFAAIHPERIPSAVERYTKEAERVRSVLDAHLGKKSASSSSSGGCWLVGDRLTAADLSWIMWEHVIHLVLAQTGTRVAGSYPHYDAWYQRLLRRPTVRKALTMRTEGLRSSLGYQVPDPF